MVSYRDYKGVKVSEKVYAKLTGGSDSGGSSSGGSSISYPAGDSARIAAGDYDVPKPTTPPQETGSPTVDVVTPSRGGGGRSGSLSAIQAVNQAGASNLPNIPTAPTQTKQSQTQQQLRGVAGSVAGKAVVSGGSVKIGGRSYTGGAYIPELGMTANQYKSYVQQQAVKQGLVDIKNIGKTSYILDVPKQEKASQTSQFQFKEIPTSEGYIYNPMTGMFIAPSPTGYGSTGYMRLPTPAEAEKIKESQYFGDEIIAAPFGVAGQYLGTIVSKPISIKKEKEIFGETIPERAINYLNPVKQYEFYKESKSTQEDIRTIREISSQIDKLNKDYNKGKIDYNTYSAKYEYLMSDPAIKRNQERGAIVTGEELIAGSDFPAPVKTALGVGIGAVQLAPYFTPVGRIILGTEQAITGYETFRNPLSLPEEKLMGGIQAGVGSVVALSGFKFSGGSTSKASNLIGKSKVLNLVKSGSVLGLGGGVGALTGISAYQQTQDIAYSVGKGIGAGGTIIGGYFIPKAFKKIEQIEQIRPVKKPIAIEKSYTLDIEGRKIPISKYKIFGETRPPLRVTRTTELREAFGLKPKSITNLPAREFEVFTPYWSIQGQPFLVSELGTGKYYGTISEIRGSSIPTDMKVFNKLSKTQQYAWKGLVEKVTGQQVSLKNVPKVLSNQEQLFTSYLEQQKIGRLNVRTKEMTFFPKGRTTTRFDTATKVKTLIDVEGTQDPFAIYRADTTFKDVTKPFARASGKTPGLTTIKFEDKTPIVLDVGEDLTRFFGEKTSKVIKSGGLGLTTTQETKVVDLPKVLPKITSTVPTKVISDTSKVFTLPLTKDVSKYAGTGQYERTNLVNVNLLNTNMGNNLFLNPELEVKTTQTNKQDNSLLSISVVTPTSVSVSKSKSAQVSKQESKLESKQATALVSVLKTNQLSKTQQQLRSQLKTQDALKYREEIPQPPKTKFKLPSLEFGGKSQSKKQTGEPDLFKVFTKKFGGKSQSKKQTGEPDLFKVFTKKFGKDIEIGKATTSGEAFNLLKKRLKTTLRASGFVETSQGVKIKPTDLGEEFTLGKREPYRLVQKRGKRLGSRQEVSEIKYFKRSKSNKGRKSKTLFGL